jgi:hypothetical protein
MLVFKQHVSIRFWNFQNMVNTKAYVMFPNELSSIYVKRRPFDHSPAINQNYGNWTIFLKFQFSFCNSLSHVVQFIFIP